MNKFFAACLLAASLLFSGAAEAADIQGNGWVETEVELYPMEDQNLNERMRVVEVVAQRKLAEEIDTLNITSTTNVEKFRLVDDTIRTRVATALRGAKIVSKNIDANNVIHAVIRINLYGGASSLANVLVPENTQVKDFPKPKFTSLESGSFSQNYTGLIIDCRDLSLATAILPAIKSEGGDTIYSSENLDRRKIVGKGVVIYSDSMDSGVQRAGDNPMIIKASYAENCDVIVSDADADKILAANQAADFLSNCAVVFVR